ncbi:MAG: hypothetical protein IH946_08005 [Bacteroidetes bacterium]|nr:hypothetical protein [Bacteroidota bacterium]
MKSKILLKTVTVIMIILSCNKHDDWYGDDYNDCPNENYGGGNVTIYDNDENDEDPKGQNCMGNKDQFSREPLSISVNLIDQLNETTALLDGSWDCDTTLFPTYICYRFFQTLDTVEMVMVLHYTENGYPWDCANGLVISIFKTFPLTNGERGADWRDLDRKEMINSALSQYLIPLGNGYNKEANFKMILMYNGSRYGYYNYCRKASRAEEMGLISWFNGMGRPQLRISDIVNYQHALKGQGLKVTVNLPQQTVFNGHCDTLRIAANHLTTFIPYPKDEYDDPG